MVKIELKLEEFNHQDDHIEDNSGKCYSTLKMLKWIVVLTLKFNGINKFYELYDRMTVGLFFK